MAFWGSAFSRVIPDLLSVSHIGFLVLCSCMCITYACLIYPIATLRSAV
jgi:hypothetical protein